MVSNGSKGHPEDILSEIPCQISLLICFIRLYLDWVVLLLSTFTANQENC